MEKNSSKEMIRLRCDGNYLAILSSLVLNFPV
jgi:hypothetical protein